MATWRRFRPCFGILAGIFLASPPSHAKVKTEQTAWLRLDEPVSHLKIDPKGRYLGFTSPEGLSLRVLELETHKVHHVSSQQVGRSFFWSPNGFRVFFRELLPKANEDTVHSQVKAYDCSLGKGVLLETMPYRTGVLTFDPRDLRMHLMSPKGIRTKKIYYPNQRLAQWQVAQRTATGKWLVTQKGVLWITEGGFSMRRLDDDGSGVKSFDVAPDGSAITWATTDGFVYVSREGGEPTRLDRGKDPKWHPAQAKVVYTGARMVGNTVVNYDLKISDTKGRSRFLTATQHVNERWPVWNPQKPQILYTVEDTTDLFVMDFKP